MLSLPQQLLLGVIIGDATAGGWILIRIMTWDSDKKCWTATLTLTDEL